MISSYINKIRFDLSEAGSFVIYNTATASYSGSTIIPTALVFNNSFIAVDFNNNSRKYIAQF